MAFEIIWSAEAGNDFRGIVSYIKEQWSEGIAEKFIHRTYHKIERLAVIPSVARPATKDEVFMYKLDHKNVLFFTIEGTYMILLSICPYNKDIKKSTYY